MPSLETNDLVQEAVLWPLTGYDSYGQPTVGPPQQIAVRWLTQKSEALDAKGNTIALDGRAIVARDIPIGSHMWLGNINDWYGTGSGSVSLQGDEPIYEVKSFNSTPDVKGRSVRRTVGLMRLHDRGVD